jgi:DNA-binding NtrC family response regulator
VVVIDDDRSVGEMIRRSLARVELNVIVRERRPMKALKRFAMRSPDVVLLDIMLPGTSGLDVFLKIREIDRKLPIIFITAGSDSSTAIKAMQLGGFDYVTKPLDLAGTQRSGGKGHRHAADDEYARRAPHDVTALFRIRNPSSDAVPRCSKFLRPLVVWPRRMSPY